jgi:uncharacterized metal-binding protein
MPGARTHDFITVATAVAATPVALRLGLTPGETGLFAGAYLVSGLFFSPDLDLHSTPYLRWGLLRVLWLPYQAVVRHRSWVSHSLLVGPAVRIAYFTLMVGLLALGGLLLLNLATPVDPTGTLWRLSLEIGGYLQRHPAATLCVLLGFAGSGATHVFADLLQTGFKRWRRRLRRLL